MKPIHLYGAVLLLILGQALFGLEERKAAKHFNACVNTYPLAKPIDVVPRCSGAY